MDALEYGLKIPKGNSYKNDFILKCSATMPDYGDDEDVVSDGLGLLHIQRLEKRCSHLPREGCAF